MQKLRIFISGKPRCGKSTIIKKVIESLDMKVAGILTPEVRNNSRTGFEIIDIASGTKGILASVNIKSKCKVGKYGVNVKDIDRIVYEFEKSFAEADLIVIDEIGKMELFSEKFKIALQKIFESEKPLLAALHRNLIKEYEKYGEVIWVNDKNRNELPKGILKRIAKTL